MTPAHVKLWLLHGRAGGISQRIRGGAIRCEIGVPEAGIHRDARSFPLIEDMQTNLEKHL